MSQDIYIQSMHISYAILWGIELSVVYDAITIFRNIIRHSTFFISAEDFIYWIFCAIFVFEHLYDISNGHMRWYIILGIGIGMIFYKMTVSKWIVKWSSFIIHKILWITGKIISFILKPFCCFFCKMKKIFRFIRKKRKSFISLLKKKLTMKVKMLKIALCKR